MVEVGHCRHENGLLRMNAVDETVTLCDPMQVLGSVTA